MKLTKNNIAIATILSLSLGAISTASATCYVSSLNVERILSYGSYSYIYLRPAGSLTNSYYNYVRTTSDKVVATAAAAKVGNSRVNVSGNATTCPTNTSGGRYMGSEANYVYITE